MSGPRWTSHPEGRVGAGQSRPQLVQLDTGPSGVMTSSTRPSSVSPRSCSSSPGTATPC